MTKKDFSSSEKIFTWPLSKKILFEDLKNVTVFVKTIDGELNIETTEPKEQV